MHLGVRELISIQCTILIFSTSGIFSKKASNFPILSLNYIFYFTCSIIIMGIYAVLWQRILKKHSLTIAYANKGTLPLMTMMWGSILFGEEITYNMVMGVIIIIFGITLVVTDHV